ncbi:MAG: MotA/TolQ/ExbB proton channel family protein [Leptospiraceae bacterium]|nr:MotA/TolQ/ExbB proton channel family protein [Leptospiraceae bacterium]
MRFFVFVPIFTITLSLLAFSPSEVRAEEPTKPTTEETEKQNPPESSAPDSAEEESASENSVIDLLIKGGYTMIGLLLISTIIAAFALERYFFFRRNKLSTKGYYERIRGALQSGGLAGLEKELSGDDLFLSRILQDGLKRKDHGRREVEKAIEMSATVETGKLERGLNLLSNLGNLAPLLGFFGTVVGMRASFLQFVEKAAPTARDLAVGVEEALITTATGLFIAMPTYLIYNLFIYNIDSVTIELERCAVAVLNAVEDEIG